MTGQISESKIGEVRERSDIVELISQYVSLKRSGANHMGLCPFHSEKSPSFSVNAARQFFHCFGCGVGGDIFSFLMKIEGLAFPDAVRRLAAQHGIDLEERVLSPEDEARQQQRERFYRVNEIAADYFHQQLMEHPAGEEARCYMKTRGYGRKAAAEYQIGFALDSWDGFRLHLEAQGQTVADAQALGLIRPRKQGDGHYDLFRKRLMFPVYDLSGRVVAFAGRVLDDSKPKYINSPESPIYHKGRVLFGLYQARQAMRQSGEVLVVEGYFDQLALYRSGFPQVVATCGTALTTEHARLLKRYVQRVILLFDQDAAGKQATFKAMTVLQEEGVPAAVIELPAGDDPDSFLQSQGVEAFRRRLEKARSVMDLFIEDTLSEAGEGIEQKARAAERIVAQITGLSSELEQDLYLKELARRSGIDLERLKQLSKKVAAQGVQLQQKRTRISAGQSDGYDYPLPEPPPDEPGREYTVAAEKKREQKPVWSRAEELLLCLFLQNYISRKEIVTAGGLELFYHSDAVKYGQLLLDHATDEGIDHKTLYEKLDPDDTRILMGLSALDQGQFGDSVNDFFTGCLQALQREQKKRQRDELHGKIRRCEQAGDSEQMKKLLKEFKNLK